MNRKLFVVSAGVLLGGTLHFGSTQEKAFEVASVRINNSSDRSSNSREGNDRVTFRNSTMGDIVRYAFGIKNYQLSAPDWFNADRYDIQAKAPEGTNDKDLPALVQSLLKERFKMVYHREPKEMSIFALVVDKGGFKGQEATDAGTGASSSIGGGGGGSVVGVGGGATGGGGSAPFSTMSSTGTLRNFADFLARNRDVNRPVIDKTGISGRYKMSLRYLPFSTEAAGDSGPSLFKALQEQLGLRLEQDKGQIEVIVIDKMEKEPTPEYRIEN